MFSSVVGLPFIHPAYKCYLFALAWPETDREYPHRSEAVLSTGHHVSVYPL
jgi:hypothetical protein